MPDEDIYQRKLATTPRLFHAGHEAVRIRLRHRLHGDKLWFFRYIGPIGRFLGLMPMLRVFTVAELKRSLTDAGFVINQHWGPDKGHNAFIVAKKAR